MKEGALRTCQTEWDHNWRWAGTRFPNRYYECSRCPARKAEHIPGWGYQPPDQQWLSGGDWTDTPATRPREERKRVAKAPEFKIHCKVECDNTDCPMQRQWRQTLTHAVAGALWAAGWMAVYCLAWLLLEG